MYKIGTSKTDITAFIKGVGMLGYGMHFNTMEEIETPLYARAYTIDDGKKKLYLVVCELCFITVALKAGVIKNLKRKYPDFGISEENLMLLAQHTHSGPGGYDHHGFYNMSIPGFSFEVYRKLVDSISTAIYNSALKTTACSIRFKSGRFADDVPVAFNRSLKAYNQNPEVDKLSEEEWHHGVNRNMLLLEFVNSDGKPIGSINWFGVHTTSVSNDNTAVCADNKGYAATMLEKHFGDNYVGAFAQSPCGDVTPKYRFNPEHKYQRGKWEGKYKDDFKSASFNGSLQFDQAISILKSEGKEISGPCSSVFKYVDASDLNVDPVYANGVSGQRTGDACFGISFFEGVWIDGPGMHPVVGWPSRRIVEVLNAYEKLSGIFRNSEDQEELIKKYEIHGNKHIIVEAAKNRLLYTKNVKASILPDFADESIRTFKFFHRIGALDDKPWIGQILPLQIFIIGSIAIVGVPFEPTYIAGERLKTSIQKKLEKSGVSEVIIAPYANAYAGYLTTYEEYQVQAYEGGHTLFGKHSLGGIQTAYDQLIEHGDEEKLQPIVFSQEEIKKRAFYVRDSYVRTELKRTEYKI